MIFHRQRHHAVGNKVLARLVALDNGGNHVLRHIGVIRQQLLGVLRQAVSAVAERRVVVMAADARVETHAIQNLPCVQAFALRVGVQLIEVCHAQRQIGVGKQLDGLGLAEAHQQRVNVRLFRAFLQ